MDINAWLRPPSSHKVISGISSLQGGVRGGKGPRGGHIATTGSNMEWVDSGWI